MDKEIKIFNEYTNNFDKNSKGYQIKYSHSLRVMKQANQIAISLNLNENDVYIATLCGLLHDIGRFRQWEEYNTFYDIDSFDHGDLGCEILKTEISKYTLNEEIQNIVKIATKYHNKYNVPEELDARTKMFCNIVRDADKIDILEFQGLKVDDESKIDEEAIKDIYHRIIVKNDHAKGQINEILRLISWIFDLNYDYSYKYIIKENIIRKKLDIIKEYYQDFPKLEEFIVKEMKGRNIC